MRLQKLQVRSVMAETPDTVFIELGGPQPSGRVDYQPGQYLTVKIPHASGTIFRCYSLSTSPYEGLPPAILVRRVENGLGSNWIADNLKAGGTIEVLPAAGAFVPADLNRDFLLYAGGSGITPVLSILKSALIRGSGKVRLVYANRAAEYVARGQEIEAWVKRYPERLSVVHWLDAERGFPSISDLADMGSGFAGADCYICGPEPYMRAAETAAKNIGVAEDRCHLELFELGTGETESVTPSGEMVSMTVDIGGSLIDVECGKDEHLLDCMLREGLNAPNSCRAGNCAACMCELVEGNVSLGENSVLDDDDIADGWVLACRSKPESEKLTVKFP